MHPIESTSLNQIASTEVQVCKCIPAHMVVVVALVTHVASGCFPTYRLWSNVLNITNTVHGPGYCD